MNISDILIEINEIQGKIVRLHEKFSAENAKISALDIDTELLYIQLLYDKYLSLKQSFLEEEKGKTFVAEEEKEEISHTKPEPTLSLFDFEETKSAQTINEIPLQEEKEEIIPETVIPTEENEKDVSREETSEVTEEHLPQEEEGNDEIIIEETIALEENDRLVNQEITIEEDVIVEENIEKEITEENQKKYSSFDDIDLDNIEFMEEEEEEFDEPEEKNTASVQDYYRNFSPQINPVLDEFEPEMNIPIKPTMEQTPDQKEQISLGDKYVSEQKSINEQYTSSPEKENNLAAKIQKGQPFDLMKAIDVNAKFLFVKELFNGNGAVFSEEMERLNQISRLSDTIEYLETLKISYRWKEDSEAYQQLYQLLLRKYSRS